ncbi:FecR domain-containing protein [Pseudomonas sp. HR96]|uniref:FecR family protein n=1 Tax=Pseudomonas sp. HR96 TaxID=1027966 RepID=UPI002A766A0C|nr:FecR domain-containing protein [Pseudomonas sp. HR96]WPO98697.1 FecR domain-containing protein [Pseudomonas sp. HR96]
MPLSEDVALLWVTRLAAEPNNSTLNEHRLPPDEQRELRHWLASDPANATAYANARRLWQLTGTAGVRLAAEQDAALQAILQRGRRRRRLHRPALALAASVLLASGLALFGQPERWLDNLRADYHSASGQLLTVDLADGSQVLLDSDSAIAVRLSDQGRDIRLLRGAAFFQVRHNGQPFVVHAEGGDISVLGTRFEVRREPAGAQVTVEEGRVAVKPAADGEAQVLTAAQRLDYRQGHAGELQGVDSQQAFGWREGRVSLRRQSLAQALAVVQRYYPGRILLLDQQLGTRLVSGDFASNDPQAMLAAFQAVLGFTQQRLPGGTLVIR